MFYTARYIAVFCIIKLLILQSGNGMLLFLLFSGRTWKFRKEDEGENLGCYLPINSCWQRGGIEGEDQLMQVLATVTWNFRPDFVSRNYESAGICEGTGKRKI